MTVRSIPGATAVGALVLSLSLAACQVRPERYGPVETEPFEMRDLAKSDTDIVAEIHLRNSFQYLRRLAEKLYRRNPREWRKAGNASLEQALGRLFGRSPPGCAFPELRGRCSIGAMRQAFADDYAGDRVLALVAGLGSMIMETYNGDMEVFVFEELDPQRMYHAARNIEIAVWKLSNDRDRAGRLFLVSNETGGPVRNLSFERLFGGIIALQDNMAEIVADATNRRIRNLVRMTATAVFMPL